MLLYWLLLMTTIIAPAQQRQDIIKWCKSIIEQRAKGVPLTKTKEFFQIRRGGRQALSRLLQISRAAKAPVEYRILALELIIYMGDSNSARSLLPLLLDAKEPIILRQKVLQVAQTLEATEFLHYLVMMLERKLSGDIRLGLYCSQLDISKQTGAVERLLTLLQSKDPQIRQQAIAFFHYIRYPGAIAKLKPLLRDPVPDIRKLALSAICHQQNYRSPQPMLVMLKDPAPLVKDQALFLLRRCCQQRQGPTPPELFRMLWPLYQKERAILDKLYRQYQQSSTEQKRLIAAYQQKPKQRQQINRALKRVRIACDNLYQRLDNQRALLRSWLETLAEINEDPTPVISEMLSWLGHEDLTMAQLAFSCLEMQARQRKFHFPAALNQKIVAGVIEYFGRLRGKKWLWRSVSRFLEQSTGAKPQATPDAWRQWHK